MFDELSMTNAMLTAAGITPVASIASTHPTFLEAREVLRKENIRMQSPGLWFNTAERELQPNSLGEIVLPGDTLHADAVDSQWRSLIINSGRMFNLDTSSFNIGVSVKLTLISLRSIDALPREAALALEETAIFRFYVQKGGVEPRLSQYRKNHSTAVRALQAAHLRNLDLNALESPSFQAFMRGSRPGYPMRY